AGIPPSQLLVVEINSQLVEFLRERFPGVSIACADARNLDALAAEHGLLRDDDKLDAVVSGLGMLSMSSELRCDILRAAFAALGDTGRFIQFTYGPVSPVRRRERELLGLRMRRVGFAMRNLPPATVYVYERLRSHEIASVRQPPRREPYDFSRHSGIAKRYPEPSAVLFQQHPPRHWIPAFAGMTTI